MELHKVSITTDGIKGVISIDGKQLDFVSRYSITHTAGGMPEVEIVLGAAEVEFNGEPMLAVLGNPFVLPVAT